MVDAVAQLDAQQPYSEDSDTETLEPAPVLKGYLQKWTNYIHGWQSRFIVLQDKTLSYCEYIFTSFLIRTQHLAACYLICRNAVAVFITAGRWSVDKANGLVTWAFCCYCCYHQHVIYFYCFFLITRR